MYVDPRSVPKIPLGDYESSPPPSTSTTPSQPQNWSKVDTVAAGTVQGTPKSVTSASSGATSRASLWTHTHKNKVVSILRAIVKAFSGVFSSITYLAASESGREWRRFEKYHYLSDQTLSGIDRALLQTCHTAQESQQMMDLVLPMKCEKPTLARPSKNATPAAKCEYHVQKAIACLYASASSADRSHNCRGDYKEFLKNLRAALAVTGETGIAGKLANEMCYAMYTQSNMTGFSKSLISHVAGEHSAELEPELKRMASTSLQGSRSRQVSSGSTLTDRSARDTPDDLSLEESTRSSMSPEDMDMSPPDDELQDSEEGDSLSPAPDAFDGIRDDVHRHLSDIQPMYHRIAGADDARKISLLGKVGQSIVGIQGLGMGTKGSRVLEFDPNMQGNPPYRKFDVQVKTASGGMRTVGNLRIGTPTKGTEITPEFKGYLRALKARGQRHTYINFQQRDSGNKGENVRSAALEALGRDPEFADTLNVFTFDKNTSFYKQTKGFAGVKTAIEFKETFLDRILGGKKTGFSVPDAIREKPNTRDELRKIFDGIHENFFEGRENLTEAERKDFIELAYTMMIDHFVTTTNANFYNNSCKDCIDRGGGANALMFYTMTTIGEHASGANGAEHGDLAAKLQLMPAMMYADAMWARKRAIIDERLERSLTAADRLMAAPSSTLTWMKESMNFASASIESQAHQTVGGSGLSGHAAPRVQDWK